METQGKDIELERLILEEVLRRGRSDGKTIHHLPIFPGYDRARIEEYGREMIADGLFRPSAPDARLGGWVGIDGLTRKGEEYLGRLSMSFGDEVRTAWRAERGEWFWRLCAVAVGGAIVALGATIAKAVFG